MSFHHWKASAAMAGLFTSTVLFSAIARAQEAVETVTVTAQKLSEARTGIQTQTGASAYTITAGDIQAQPGGENEQLNQVLLQAPSVVQDSFGQFHVRGEHAALQYRLNGVILPEGISVFGQTLDPRLVGSMNLLTGALPAEYGLVTGGIVDIHTKSGLFEPGGQVGIYGGSHSEIEPSFDYGGSSGNFNYFVAGDYLSNTLGIESPDGSPDPLHDRTTQYHGFAYLEDILDEHSSISAIVGVSNDRFQIPNSRGLQPDAGFVVNGQTDFLSNNLDERQREITDFGTLSYLHSQGNFDFQVSGFFRYSSLAFKPDELGDLLYNGIAQSAFKSDKAYGAQADGAWHIASDHTIRMGLLFEYDDATSDTLSSVLHADCAAGGIQPCTENSDLSFDVLDNGTATQKTYSVYLQDEWKVFDNLTINYGLRWDRYDAFSSGDQLSPRANVVWQATDSTTVHVGYSRYFSPPPFENIATESIDKFLNTTAAPNLLLNDTPKAERANYFDAGVSQKVMENITLGVDSYYKKSKDLIDEGQFGAPIILTPFNYKDGKQYGLEFTADYTTDNLLAYANFALVHAEGKDIVSSQFQFDPGDLAYIQDHFIHLDHEQYLTISSGASYKLWEGTRLSADLLYGSGLRKDGAVPNGEHVPGYTVVNLGVSQDFDLGPVGGLTARFDVINVFDKEYEIRDGSGIGVGAPQFGARRGFFAGLSKSI
ncbi:MAG TPA: TonB-dependent receptor [Rhizomicrobium sp.]|jgi:outer membrane receptor protein involved in Fe transport|nr:TonB-dependent receptor [Rhizomicrobium sp.]